MGASPEAAEKRGSAASARVMGSGESGVARSVWYRYRAGGLGLETAAVEGGSRKRRKRREQMGAMASRRGDEAWKGRTGRRRTEQQRQHKKKKKKSNGRGGVVRSGSGSGGEHGVN
jgi:hypothetical protein